MPATDCHTAAREHTVPQTGLVRALPQAAAGPAQAFPASNARLMIRAFLYKDGALCILHFKGHG